MNTRLVNSAAGVVNAALARNVTAAGVAMALESVGLLMSPETAAELEQLRSRVADAVATVARLEQKRVELERIANAERGRVAELEAEPLAWASKLDAKSLDNFLIALGSFSEHEPMDEAVDRIHELLRSYREATSVDGITWLFAPTQALREDEPAAEQPLTVFRASHESIVMGLYTTAAAAREHCETLIHREQPDADLNWYPDTTEGGDEDAPEGLFMVVAGEESDTGYVVTPLTVASEYDAEADE